ncbi:MAG: DUF5058 family protein [Acutalibacteraceae bacterium]|nr:DUF5058 family protein [Acutalibacteraceae bacterium]
MDFKSSPALYLIAGAVILFVLGQSIFFLVKAYKQGQALGLDKSKLRNAITSSALFTIPSALSVLATVIALAPALGLVIPWVRLSVIGNLMYETTAAEAAMEAFGHEGGMAVPVTDPEVYAGVAWVMTLGICFSLVILPFVAKPLHKKLLQAGKKADAPKAEATENAPADTKKKRGLNGFINDFATPAIFIGLIGAFIARAIIGAGKPETFGDGAGVLSIITLVVAVVVSIALEILAKKFKLSWLEPFVMPIGMIIAMIAAIIFFNVLPEEIAIFEWRG